MKYMIFLSNTTTSLSDIYSRIVFFTILIVQVWTFLFLPSPMPCPPKDVVQQITNPDRRRRSALVDREDEIMQFVSDGGIDALVDGFPEVIVPLMVSLSPYISIYLSIYSILSLVFTCVSSNINEISPCTIQYPYNIWDTQNIWHYYNTVTPTAQHGWCIKRGPNWWMCTTPHVRS